MSSTSRNKQIKKAEHPKEPYSKHFATDADGYKRITRKNKPDEPPFSNSYVTGSIEAYLLSAYHCLDNAVGILKNSGLNKLDFDGNGRPLGHVKALLHYTLILGRHIRGESNSDYFKEFVAKTDDIEDWNDMFPLNEPSCMA